MFYHTVVLQAVALFLRKASTLAPIPLSNSWIIFIKQVVYIYIYMQGDRERESHQHYLSDRLLQGGGGTQLKDTATLKPSDQKPDSAP